MTVATTDVGYTDALIRPELIRSQQLRTIAPGRRAEGPGRRPRHHRHRDQGRQADADSEWRFFYTGRQIPAFNETDAGSAPQRNQAPLAGGLEAINPISRVAAGVLACRGAEANRE